MEQDREWYPSSFYFSSNADHHRAEYNFIQFWETSQLSLQSVADEWCNHSLSTLIHIYIVPFTRSTWIELDRDSIQVGFTLAQPLTITVLNIISFNSEKHLSCHCSPLLINDATIQLSSFTNLLNADLQTMTITAVAKLNLLKWSSVKW